MDAFDQRMQILRMLEHGEITAEEAVRMIEAQARGKPLNFRRAEGGKVKWLRGPNNQRIELTIS
jgi:hypothetical protein